MASIVVSGDTSGAVTLSAPSVAGTTTVTLPSSTGTMALLQTPSFATTIGVGGATASTSGSGISFPATQSASSNANTLDDYEEGSWTPVWASSGNLPTLFYSTQVGKYVKIGKVVHFWGRIYMSSWGTGGTGVIRVGGLPFTVQDLGTDPGNGNPSNGGSLCHIIWTRSSASGTAFPSGATQVLGRILPSSTQIEYISMGNTDNLGETGTIAWTSNPAMFNNYFAGTYITT